jgi:hypothetical protein
MINTKCTNCEQGEKLQMKEKENLKEDAEPASVMKSLGAGKPLENRTRAKMEEDSEQTFQVSRSTRIAMLPTCREK